MMNRRRFAATGAATLASIAFVRRPGDAAEFTFRWGHATQVDHPLAVNAKRVSIEVARRTNGRLEIALFPNNILGGDTAMLTQVRSGALQLYSGYGGIYSVVAPLAGIEAVGFAFTSQEQALRAFDGPLGAVIRRQMDEKGGLVTFERAWVNGFREITTSTKPIRTVADMDGLKIRTPTAPIWLDMFRALGASPTPINASEMYSALQTHVVDAQENPFTIIKTYRLFDVQKYISVTNHMWSNFWVVANAAAFNALPAGLQSTLRDTINEMALHNRREMQLSNDSLADQLGRLGMIVNRPDTTAFRPKLKEFYAKYKAQFGAEAWGYLEARAGSLG